YTENGLIESSPTFMLLLALSLVLEPGPRYPGRARPQRPYALAEPLPIARRERTLV
ncbi:MAG: hypothetical protein JWN36_774, partial [Microbacteriaceae bacterium]|nr:hypothetical protein [Microbacteriaceae bacterium]